MKMTKKEFRESCFLSNLHP